MPKRIFDLAYLQLERYPNLNMFSTKVNGKWEFLTTEQFLQKTMEVSKALIHLGVEKNDKIALVTENRVEWNIIDVAVQQIGAVLVAVYPNISTKDYRYIFNDAAIKFAFVSSEAIYEKINPLRGELPELKEIFTFNEVPNAIHWNALFNYEETNEGELVEQRKNAVTTDDLLTLIYTSGTTGDPKGVMLTHSNMIAEVYGTSYATPAVAYDRALTFLPVCHAYERMFHYIYINKGISIYFAESIDALGENFKEVKPHIFGAVPRVLEKVYGKIMATGNALPPFKKKIFHWAISVGEKYELEGNSAFYNFKLAIARKLVFSKWVEALGGEVKGCTVGSAAMQERLLRLFLAAGVPLLEGYGLTEASPCVAVNCYKRGRKIGTVGPLLINAEAKIAEDGEILIKGGMVMKGYYNKPDETAKTIIDGWLHTGDIGEIVDGKFLKITDRKKEIFKTSGGKYIIPQQMENKFGESKYIEQIMVIGEGEKFPAAFIIPSYAELKVWAKFKRLKEEALPREEFLNSEVVKLKIEKEVARINKEFGNFEQIKKIAILVNEFTVETGELTPTLKFKRKIILEKYKKQYQMIYSDKIL